jgi:hypothetical protein
MWHARTRCPDSGFKKTISMSFLLALKLQFEIRVLRPKVLLGKVWSPTWFFFKVLKATVCAAG